MVLRSSRNLTKWWSITKRGDGLPCSNGGVRLFDPGDAGPFCTALPGVWKPFGGFHPGVRDASVRAVQDRLENVTPVHEKV